MWKSTLCSFCVGLLLAAPTLAFAHHSGAMFDRSKIVALRGTVLAYEYTNPHTWIRFVVLGVNGAVVEWDVEGAAPSRMSRWGITPQTVKAGDKVFLRLHPLKDGRNGGILIDITYPDGKVLGTPDAH